MRIAPMIYQMRIKLTKARLKARHFVWRALSFLIVKK